MTFAAFQSKIPCENDRNADKCRRQSLYYQALFPDVPIMSSLELLRRHGQQNPSRRWEDVLALRCGEERIAFPCDDDNDTAGDDDNKVMTTPSQSNEERNMILVDVRTHPERCISMIPGAISLSQFEHEIMRSPSVLRNVVVVTYCTIGYRSAMEARRLRRQYGIERDSVYSLDGIVPYTHSRYTNDYGADARDDGTDEAKMFDGHSDVHIPKLVEPQSGKETKRVHTFAKSWGYVNEQDGFEGVHFGPGRLVVWGMQVGLVSASRTVKSFISVGAGAAERRCCCYSHGPVCATEPPYYISPA